MKNIFFILFTICFTAQAKEHRKMIVVIDTGLIYTYKHMDYMCETPALSLIKGVSPYLAEFSHPSDGHGTNVVGLIGERIDKNKYCILMLRAFKDGAPIGYESSLKLTSMLKGHVVGLNLSLSGKEPNAIETEHLKVIIANKVKVFVAAGNEKTELKKDKCPSYPACLQPELGQNIIVVKNIKKSETNFGDYIHMVERNGQAVGFPKNTGTSQSTAIYTGEYFSK